MAFQTFNIYALEHFTARNTAANQKLYLTLIGQGTLSHTLHELKTEWFGVIPDSSGQRRSL